jgi:hypothetical protein
MTEDLVGDIFLCFVRLTTAAMCGSATAGARF